MLLVGCDATEIRTNQQKLKLMTESCACSINLSAEGIRKVGKGIHFEINADKLCVRTCREIKINNVAI